MSPPPVLRSPRLAALPGVRHAFFTRQGGVSEGVYASLNLGFGSKDDPERVAENKRRAAAALGVGEDCLLTVYQVHSARCVRAEGPGQPRVEADGLATRVPGLALGALAADCAPVLIADAQARVVGACHAGWKGALSGIVEATVAEMAALGADPAAMVAAVGPCIAPASYEVGLDFLDRFAAEDPGSERFFAAGVSAAKRQFDLPAYVLSRLARAGVHAAEWTSHDTCADPERFHSNRRAFKNAEPDYGRPLSAILLDP
jgi:YfiH family protein